MTNLPLGEHSTEQPANDAGYTKLMATKPGQRLREARLSNNLTIDFVAERLHLSVSYLRALEADRYDALPGATFVKGYIRSYARLVNLSGAELVHSYEQQLAATDVAQPAESLTPPSRKSPLPLLALIVLVIAAAAGWFFNGFGFDQSLVLQNEPQVADSRAPANSPSDTAEQVQTDTVAEEVAQQTTVKPEPKNSALLAIPVVLPEDRSSDPQNNSATLAEQTVVKVAEKPAAVIKRSSVAVPPVAQAAAVVKSKPGTLTMIFTDDCWVEIRNGKNAKVHSNLHAAGSYFSYAIAKPFKVKLGDGKAVRLSYNGSQLPITTSSRSNVAKISVDI